MEFVWVGARLPANVNPSWALPCLAAVLPLAANLRGKNAAEKVSGVTILRCRVIRDLGDPLPESRWADKSDKE